jgi:hypothetical protein
MGAIDELANCIKGAHKDKILLDQCEKKFVAEGGKVFASADGGKVFSLDGSDQIVTEGGKVFQHKP